mgnify:CR=1 FL=1
MVRLSPEEKAEIRRLALKGLPVREIARQMGRPPTTIVDFIERTQRLAAPVRERSVRQLCLAEREEISRGLAEGRSVRVIAARIGRSPSTVCREVGRNGGRRHYRAAAAEDRAWVQGCRPKVAKLAGDPVLRAVVEEKLGLQWSPQQISGWLRVEFADRVEMQVSHETIYRSLFVQARGELRRELAKHLRTGRTSRKPQGRKETRGKLVGTVPISARPAEAADRAVPGHWEGDLLMGGVGFLHHLTSASEACKSIIRRFEGDIHPGDLFLLNDPYTAALHTSDIYLIAPIHFEGELVAWRS